MFCIYKVKPLVINFKPSYALSALITLMSFFMGSILIPLHLYWQIKLALLLVIAFSAAYAVCCHGLLLMPWSYASLQVNVKNELKIIRRDGVELAAATVAADSVVTPYLTVIGFNQENASLFSRVFSSRLVVLPDALDAESYRQLRVWLRWGRPYPD